MPTHSEASRVALGFLTAAQTDALGEAGVHVLDPGSTLVSGRGVTLTRGVVLYPGVTLECHDDGSRIAVGAETTLHSGTRLAARHGGRIAVGAKSELGPGGVYVHADATTDRVEIGDEVRLSGGCELSGASQLGRGTQILGAVIARGVTLGGGRGGYRWPTPDERGAVLKGAGIAERLTLNAGEVRSCRSSFADAPTERQSTYHPPPVND